MIGLERFDELICDIVFFFRINDGNVALVGVCIRIQLKYDIGCKVAAFYHVFYDIARVLLGFLCFFLYVIFHFWVVDCEEHVVNEP